MGFREHGILLYMDKNLSLAFVKLQADKSLGRSFAGLLAFVEGLHQMGYLTQAQYMRYRKKYSTPLNKDPHQITLQEHEEAQEKKQQRRFSRWELFIYSALSSGSVAVGIVGLIKGGVI